MNAVNAYVENVMLGPARDLLERRLIGQFKISGFEIQSYVDGMEHAFIGLLQARIVDTIGRMADVAIGRDDVRDYSHARGEFPRVKRWDSDAEHLRADRDFHAAATHRERMYGALRAAAEEIREDSTWNGPVLITTPASKARFAAANERLLRSRNEAAFAWTRLRPWQWRKRRRLWRKLYGIGGWRVDVGPVDYGIPERVTPCGRLGRLREGGC